MNQPDFGQFTDELSDDSDDESGCESDDSDDNDLYTGSGESNEISGDGSKADWGNFFRNYGGDDCECEKECDCDDVQKCIDKYKKDKCGDEYAKVVRYCFDKYADCD